VSDLEQWLSLHGLQRYAKTFADNDIDLDVLVRLTDADLEKLGLSLGHRRKLLGLLEAEPIAASRSAPPSGPAVSAPSESDAERRQVTCLFCDLVASTEFAAALDPEDAAAQIRRYQDACAGAVARWNGYIAKFMGDGLLAYFGYPHASEDSAEHAVRSGLAIVDAVGELERPDGRALRVRVGIATGVVVIGEIVGTGSARERSVSGDTPNLAARLQALAEPGAILVSQRTHQLLGKRFEYQNLGEYIVKGFPTPIAVWRVLCESSAESRFATAVGTKRGAFVGRKDESSLLLDLWRRAANGNGQALLISGDAGMGKSRLVDALSEQIAGERNYRVTCQCSPYHINSALHPVIRHLERAAGLANEDATDVQLDKIEAMLRGSRATVDPRSASLIGDLLGLATDRYPPLDLTPAQRKGATHAVLVELLTRLAVDAPVLLLLEDAHWIDPTTKELWTRLLEGIAETRLLAVITARPEFVSPWTNRAHVVSLELTRLTNSQASQLVAEVAAPHPIDDAVVADIVAKGDGVPLYVEELTRAFLDSPNSEQPTVPATLHDSLMARLDRLGPAKEIAQVAAVIGQQFSQALLAAVVSYSQAELADGLLRLLEAGLAYRRVNAPEESYSFKHALVRDAAYENLLRTRRQQLHGQIGSTLAANFSSIAENEPEMLAHHFHHARLWDLACAYRERAGDRAVARSSYPEAVAHFTAALSEAAQLSEGAERTKRELALLLKLGPPIIIVKSPQSPETEEVYRRARERAAALSDEPGLFKSTWGLWYNSLTGRRLDRARDNARDLMTLSRKSGDGDLLLEAFHCRWSTAWFRGDVTTSWEAAREGVVRYDRAKHAWMGPVFGGHDPGVCAYVVQALNLAARGRNAQARRSIGSAIALAEELGHENSRAHALMNSLVVGQLARDCKTLGADGQRTIDLAEKYNMPPHRSHALLLSGWALAFGSDLRAGVAAMEGEYPRASAVGPFFRFYAALLAEGLEKAGRFTDALSILRPALATVTEPGVGIFVSELYRLQGLCLLHSTDGRDEAMHSLRTAVAVARQQGATVLELRAAVSLARAAMAADGRATDVEPLREVCAELPAEFDAPDREEARELLGRATSA